MCLVAVKYFPQMSSWVGIKNRDRSSKPLIRVRKSFRRGVERLYIWDDSTKYTEGINEFGVSILSAGFDAERDTVDGLAIRTALFEQTPELAAQKIFDLRVRGRTYIFTKEKAFVVHIEDDNGTPVNMVNMQLSPSDPHVFISTEGPMDEFERWKVAMKETKLSRNATELLDGMSVTDAENPQDNPLIIDTKRRSMRTIGQTMIIPSEMTMHYRAIWGDVRFRLDKLNSPSEKTFFEIVSNRRLINFGEQFEIADNDNLIEEKGEM